MPTPVACRSDWSMTPTGPHLVRSMTRSRTRTRPAEPDDSGRTRAGSRQFAASAADAITGGVPFWSFTALSPSNRRTRSERPSARRARLDLRRSASLPTSRRRAGQGVEWARWSWLSGPRQLRVLAVRCAVAPGSGEARTTVPVLRRRAIPGIGDRIPLRRRAGPGIGDRVTLVGGPLPCRDGSLARIEGRGTGGSGLPRDLPRRLLRPGLAHRSGTTD